MAKRFLMLPLLDSHISGIVPNWVSNFQRMQHFHFHWKLLVSQHYAEKHCLKAFWDCSQFRISSTELLIRDSQNDHVFKGGPYINYKNKRKKKRYIKALPVLCQLFASFFASGDRLNNLRAVD